MSTFSISTRGLLGASTLVASMALLAACGSKVDGGGSGGSGGESSSVGTGGAGGTMTSVGTGGTGGTMTSSSTSGGGAGPSGEAIAMLYSQIPPPGGGSSGESSSVASGNPVDPSTLYIFLGNHAIACNDPYGDVTCSEWDVTIGIPTSLQKPGVIKLDNPEIISNFSVNLDPDASGMCGGGGGSFWDGTLEIVSIDDAQVVGKLENTATFDFDANGDFTALRCPN